MTDNNLSHVGDQDELENCCRNVLELDLSKNEFMDWNEVYIFNFSIFLFKITNVFKKI